MKVELTEVQHKTGTERQSILDLAWLIKESTDSPTIQGMADNVKKKVSKLTEKLKSHNYEILNKELETELQRYCKRKYFDNASHLKRLENKYKETGKIPRNYKGEDIRELLKKDIEKYSNGMNFLNDNA